MSIESEWRTRVGAGVAFGVVVGVTVSGAWSDSATGSVDWAGWFQGFVALIAIGAAWFGISYQLKNAEFARRRSILAIAEAVGDRVDQIARALVGHPDEIFLINVYWQGAFDGLGAALDAAPKHEIGSRGGVLAILEMRDLLRSLDNRLQTIDKGPWKNPDFVELSKLYDRASVAGRKEFEAHRIETKQIYIRNAMQVIEAIREKNSVLQSLK